MGEEKYKRLALWLLLIGKIIVGGLLFRYFQSGKLSINELKVLYFILSILLFPSFFLFLKDYLRNRKIKRFSQKLIRSQVVQLSFLIVFGYLWFFYYFLETSREDPVEIRFYNLIMWFCTMEAIYGSYLGFFVFPLFRRRRSRLPKGTS